MRGFTAMSVEAAALQHVCHTVDGVLTAAGGTLKGGGIHEGPRQRPCLAFQTFQQHADGHARREGVGVDDQVRPGIPEHCSSVLATALGIWVLRG